MKCFFFNFGSLFYICLISALMLTSSAFGFPPLPMELNEETYVEGELLVKFKEGLSDNEKDNVHRRYNSQIVKRHAYGFDHIKSRPNKGVRDAIAEYEADPDIAFAEPNWVFYAQAEPNDPLFDYQWSFNNTATKKAWDITTGNNNNVIAVFDTGIDVHHADLTAHIVDNFDGVTSSSDPANEPYLDTRSHGTHVAGIIGATTYNGVGVAGSNWYINLMNCKVRAEESQGGDITLSSVMNCIDHLIDTKNQSAFNFVAINASFGNKDLDHWIQGVGQGQETLYQYIQQDDLKETLFIAAAGNADKANGNYGGNKGEANNDLVPFYPASFSLPNVISVAATDSQSELAQWYRYTNGTQNYSCYGKRSVHIGAPGKDILSTFLLNGDDYTCQPEKPNCSSAFPKTCFTEPLTNPQRRYCTLSGTSMAAPHVSGLAALIKSKLIDCDSDSTCNTGHPYVHRDPNKDWLRIKNLILSGGNKVTALEDRTITGRRLNPYESLNWTMNGDNIICDTTNYDKKVFSVLKGDPGYGSSSTFRAISIDCASSAGPVTVQTNTGQNILLHDDGVSPDLAAEDGMFTAYWIPADGTNSVSVQSPAGTEYLYSPKIEASQIPTSMHPGDRVEFSFTVEDLDNTDQFEDVYGNNDIARVMFMLRDNFVYGDYSNSIIVYFDRVEKALVLYDAYSTTYSKCGCAIQGGVASCSNVGADPYNSRAILLCQSSKVDLDNPNKISVTLGLITKSSFVGSKKVYAYAFDTTGLDSPVKNIGEVTIDSADKLGVFRNGMFYLDFNNDRIFEGCSTDICASFGLSTDTPISGNFNESISGDEIGTKSNVNWYIDYNGNRQWDNGVDDRSYTFGLATDIPVTGNWGVYIGILDKIGVFRSGAWYLDLDGNGRWDGTTTDRYWSFGLGTDVPVTGDWNGDGITEVGTFRNGTWYLDHNGNGKWNGIGQDQDVMYSFGLATDIPVTGDWNNDGKTEIGTFRNGTWYLDLDRSGTWNASLDGTYSFGTTGDKPVTGRW